MKLEEESTREVYKERTRVRMRKGCAVIIQIRVEE